MAPKKQIELVSDENRQKGYDLIYDQLDKYKDDYLEIATDEFLENTAFNIEEAMYTGSPAAKDYKPRLITILSNLSITVNAPAVRKRIFTSEWSPEEFGKMSHKDMNPELEKERNDEKEKNKRIEETMKQMRMDVDSFYVCRKCKSTKVEHYQKQTRSADEPMTVFCHCLMCDKRWKE